MSDKHDEEGYREANRQWSVEITAPVPVRFIKLETAYDRAYAAGLAEGRRQTLKEAAEKARAQEAAYRRTGAWGDFNVPVGLLAETLEALAEEKAGER